MENDVKYYQLSAKYRDNETGSKHIHQSSTIFSTIELARERVPKLIRMLTYPGKPTPLTVNEETIKIDVIELTLVE